MPKQNAMRRSSDAERRRLRPLIMRLLIMSLLLPLLAACASAPPGLIFTGAPAATPTPVPSGLFDASFQATSFEQVQQGIDGLYRDHPGINAFIANGVTYKPETRDKVLKICHEGGLAGSDVELAAQKALACAPLIFFFYRYGQEASVPDAMMVARQLYWFASANTPGEPAQVMTDLLRSWGVK